MKQIIEYLPIKAISVNECWQGRRFKTKKYDAFIKEMLYSMPKREMIKGETKVTIFLHLKSLTRSDIDNFCKPIIDCLVKRGWIEDDRYIQHLEVIKTKMPQEAIELEIRKYET